MRRRFRAEKGGEGPSKEYYKNWGGGGEGLKFTTEEGGKYLKVSHGKGRTPLRELGSRNNIVGQTARKPNLFGQPRRKGQEAPGAGPGGKNELNMKRVTLDLGGVKKRHVKGGQEKVQLLKTNKGGVLGASVRRKSPRKANPKKGKREILKKVRKEKIFYWHQCSKPSSKERNKSKLPNGKKGN